MNAVHLMDKCFPSNGFLWETTYRETLHIVFIFCIHLLIHNQYGVY